MAEEPAEVVEAVDSDEGIIDLENFTKDLTDFLISKADKEAELLKTGIKIKAWREKLGMLQGDFAKLFRISTQSVVRMEKGSHLVTDDMYEKIYKVVRTTDPETVIAAVNAHIEENTVPEVTEQTPKPKVSEGESPPEAEEITIE